MADHRNNAREVTDTHTHAFIDDRDNVIFAEASPSQQECIWDLNSATWAGLLSLADYKARERHLSSTELVTNRGMRTFLLHFANNPLDVISACELFHRIILVRSPAGTVESRGAFGIASVYTAPRYRRKGMTGFMLRKLQDVMDTEGGGVSVLFDDIAGGYYARLGWTAFSSAQATIRLIDSPPPSSYITPTHNVSTSHIRVLSMEDEPEMRQLCERDVEQLKARLSAGEPGSDMTRLAFAPSYKLLA